MQTIMFCTSTSESVGKKTWPILVKPRVPVIHKNPVVAAVVSKGQKSHTQQIPRQLVWQR